MRSKEAIARAQAKYAITSKGKWRNFCLKLNKENDADIIKHLESLPNMQGYIKDLIRKDMG